MQADNQETIKALRHWLFVKPLVNQRIPNMKGQ